MSGGIPPHWHLLALVGIGCLLYGENHGTDLKVKFGIVAGLVLLVVALL